MQRNLYKQRNTSLKDFKFGDQKFSFGDFAISNIVVLEYVSCVLIFTFDFQAGSVVKNLPAMLETWVGSLGWEDPLEKDMTTYSSVLAWKIPRTEEPGGLHFMRSQESVRTQQLNSNKSPLLQFTKYIYIYIYIYIKDYVSI